MVGNSTGQWYKVGSRASPTAPKSGGVEMIGDLVMDPKVYVSYGSEYFNIK